MELLDAAELVPSLLSHTLPHRGSEVGEADVYSWDGCLLVELLDAADWSHSSSTICCHTQEARSVKRMFIVGMDASLWSDSVVLKSSQRVLRAKRRALFWTFCSRLMDLLLRA